MMSNVFAKIASVLVFITAFAAHAEDDHVSNLQSFSGAVVATTSPIGLFILAQGNALPNPSEDDVLMVLALTPSFGLGQAIQDRYSSTGWIVTLLDLGSLLCFPVAASDVGGFAMCGGILLGSRLFEAGDAWVGAIRNVNYASNDPAARRLRAREDYIRRTHSRIGATSRNGALSLSLGKNF